MQACHMPWLLQTGKLMPPLDRLHFVGISLAGADRARPRGSVTMSGLPKTLVRHAGAVRAAIPLRTSTNSSGRSGMCLEGRGPPAEPSQCQNPQHNPQPDTPDENVRKSMFSLTLPESQTCAAMPPPLQATNKLLRVLRRFFPQRVRIGHPDAELHINHVIEG